MSDTAAYRTAASLSRQLENKERIKLIEASSQEMYLLLKRIQTSYYDLLLDSIKSRDGISWDERIADVELLNEIRALLHKIEADEQMSR